MQVSFWIACAVIPLTLVGVAESARERGVQLSFGEYLKAGVPITLVSLVLGVLWLTVV